MAKKCGRQKRVCLVLFAAVLRQIEAFYACRSGFCSQLPFCRLPRAVLFSAPENIDFEASTVDSYSDEELPPLTRANWTGPSESSGAGFGAKTLDGRLLCASICAYEIDQDEPYFRGALYSAGSRVTRTSRGVNSVLVGETVDGIVVSFRGTRTSSPLDWLQNAAIFLAKFPKEGIQGKIHAGFNRAVLSLYKPMKKALLDLINSCYEDDAIPNIYLSGHSKGGALASIAAILMKNDPDLPDPAYVCTFASARVGNSLFRDQYNREVNQTSYESHLDLIPFLPPSNSVMEGMDEESTEMVEDILWAKETRPKKEGYVWDYRPLGRRRFIDKDSRIRDDVTKSLDDQRIRDIEEKTLLSIRRFGAAHCSSCPSGDSCDGGYILGVAPEICGGMNEQA